MPHGRAAPPALLCFPQLLLRTIFSWPAPWPGGVQDHTSLEDFGFEELIQYDLKCGDQEPMLV